jgi:type II secretory pathway pseudopilin PulG
MIEVLLALGVVAIGVVSVLALFPVGLSSARDAMAETYAANAAEQLLHSIRYTIEESDANWNTWVTDATWSTRPLPGELGLDAALIGAGAFGGSTRGAIHEQTLRHVYKVVAYRDVDDDGEFDGPPNEPPDFQCVAAVWGEQIQLPGGATVGWAFGTRINVEVSWPGELPYTSRFKRVYSLEVFNAKN